MPRVAKSSVMDLRHKLAVATLILLANAEAAHAQAGPKAITSKTTVAEFALECQHPAMKGRPEIGRAHV